ncbi:hypothetical protein QR685DRAFT_108216 [Neurospora intermedia]|uniref:Uncharacterized protein n=1 Tax=Neurospora intermedia TaxID=5142 RepID=A0ABR3D3J2_NEUIN
MKIKHSYWELPNTAQFSKLVCLLRSEPCKSEYPLTFYCGNEHALSGSRASLEPLQNLQRIFPSPAARPLQQQRTEDTNRHQSWNFAFGIRRCPKSQTSFDGTRFHSAITSRPVQPHLPPSAARPMPR